MRRTLRFARGELCPLKDNAGHAFAAPFALCIYRSDSIYTFIPKNGCSTMRYSLAIENGCIVGPEGFDWVHNNNRTFSATLRDLVTARSTFVILRCPFARLASFYLDKVVTGRPVAVERSLRLPPADVPAMTFRQMASAMLDPALRKANSHWRNQCDFLIYEEYDRYFRLEAFAEAAAEIRRMTGLEVLDARGLSRHGLEGLELDAEAAYADVPASAIALMKAAGRAPAPRALFDAAIVDAVAQAYADDIALYRRLFGPSDLMFG